ncbi:hypothetical protein EG329_011820 [Mollisiaceae sp. DMI_Dod_QoI]|nr:hypothetical protein EG329_011820 [Helotiales sp. DMI_Dod_QoI]
MPSSSSSSRPQPAGYFYRPPSQRDLRPRNPLTPPDLSGTSIPSSSIDPVRKITPPEEHSIHTDEKLVGAEDLYKQAEQYVEEYRASVKPGLGQYLSRPLEVYETPLRIKMSIGDWIKLDRKLNPKENDDPYPRLSYNAATSTLIIECMASPLHQSITSILAEQFVESKATLSRDLKRQTYVSWETTNNEFGSEWAGSRKRPDFSIKVRDASGKLKLKWVVEAGLSETYSQLFCESPQYRCPIPTTQDPQELGISLDILAIKTEEVTMEGQLGPATYKGYKWVGKISEVFMEIWVQDASGKAVRQDNREDLLQAGQLQLSFGDILPPGYPQTITLDLDEFHNVLKEEIQELAAHRCREMVIEWVKRMGDRQSDRNYQPSQESASE